MLIQTGQLKIYVIFDDTSP